MNLGGLQSTGPGIGVLDARYVNVAGDTMTGALLIQATSSAAFEVSNAAGAIDYFRVDTNTTQTGALLQITDDVLGGDFLSLRGADHGMEFKATTVDTALANVNHNTWQLDIDNTVANDAVYRGLLYNLNVNEDFDITGSLQGVFFACLNNGTGTIATTDANTSFTFNVSTGTMTDVHGFNAIMGSLGGTVTRYTAYYVGGSVGTLGLAAVLGDGDDRFRTSSSFHYNRGGTLKYITISDAADGITLDGTDLTFETTTSGDINITSVDNLNLSATLINLTSPLKTSAVRRKITEVTTSTYTILATDHHLSIQYTDTGTQTTTLPALSATNHGQEYQVKDADYNAGTNNITIDTTGADTLEEQADGTMNQDGMAWTIVANNTTKNWEIY